MYNNLYVYIYINIFICICIYQYYLISIYVHTYNNIYVHIYISIYVYACISFWGLRLWLPVFVSVSSVCRPFPVRHKLSVSHSQSLTSPQSDSTFNRFLIRLNETILSTELECLFFLAAKYHEIFKTNQEHNTEE